MNNRDCGGGRRVRRSGRSGSGRSGVLRGGKRGGEGMEDVEGCNDESAEEGDLDADGADAAVVDEVSRSVEEDEDIGRREVGVAVATGAEEIQGMEERKENIHDVV